MIDVSWMHGLARGVGKTTGLAKVADYLNGTLVTFNSAEASRVAREHRVRAVAWYQIESQRGRSGPLIWETEAVACLADSLTSNAADAERDLVAAATELVVLLSRLRPDMRLPNGADWECLEVAHNALVKELGKRRPQFMRAWPTEGEPL